MNLNCYKKIEKFYRNETINLTMSIKVEYYGCQKLCWHILYSQCEETAVSMHLLRAK